MFVVTLNKASLKKVGIGAMCCALVAFSALLGRYISTRTVAVSANGNKIESAQDIQTWFTGYGLDVDGASITADKVKIPRKWDDSFSALDYKTDVTLRRALKAETGDATVIIVAQRISTVLHANQILVLDEGRLVGRGTHAQLMASCPEYQEIARSQLSQKELDLKDLNTGKEEK